MVGSRLLPVVLSILIILVIAVIQERSKFLAAIIATMPVTIPLTLWVVFSANQGDYQQTESFTASMIGGIIATFAFVLAVWAGLRARLPFPAVLLCGYAVWGLVNLLGGWIAGGK
jgi:hypothetical protein